MQCLSWIDISSQESGTVHLQHPRIPEFSQSGRYSHGEILRDSRHLSGSLCFNQCFWQTLRLSLASASAITPRAMCTRTCLRLPSPCEEASMSALWRSASSRAKISASEHQNSPTPGSARSRSRPRRLQAKPVRSTALVLLSPSPAKEKDGR